MGNSEAEIPPGGGSLLIAWQLKDRRVLIVGGGEVASSRIKSILIADAYITVVAPRDGLHPLTEFYIENCNRIIYHDRTFHGPDDLDGIDMVLTAIDDVEWSRRICDLSRERRIPINVADAPPSCDFYFGSQIRKGPLQIMISTNGNGPKLANIIKSRIEKSLPENVDKAITNIGSLRAKLRQRAPGVGGEISKRRMQWISSLCTIWPLDELTDLDEPAMEKLLVEGWERDIVPRSPRLKASNGSSYTFEILFATLIGFFIGIAFCIAVLWEQNTYGTILRDVSSFIRENVVSPLLVK